ncbi:MAG TPA: polysaccharide deacetylase family protein [Nonomuraea sp.]|nr:polysaccharide deacetylase family protein [Nonomuraea sp.]
MRVCVWPLALLALAGCVTHPMPHHQPDTSPANSPDASVRPTTIDPERVAQRLASAQSGWPRDRAHDCTRIKCVALTFDDGPSRYTGRLLDLLGRRDVRATFFVVGQMVAAEPDGRTVRRIVGEGHELGNHTWSHPMLTALSPEQLTHELAHTENVVRRLTGVRMQVMRPPFGATDKRVAAASRHAGLAQILWHVDTLDWRDRVPEKVARRAGRAAPGSIILMHDTHRSTVRAVPEIIGTLARKGYAFVTVSELVGRTPVPGATIPELQQ